MRSIVLVLLVVLCVHQVYAHCQVPCGIYDDPLRVTQLLEDVSTIKKAVHEIEELHSLGSSQTATQANQLVRWVNTKEKHASDMITLLSEYFMVQVWNSCTL